MMFRRKGNVGPRYHQPDLLAPEVHEHDWYKGFDHKSDMWLLGVALGKCWYPKIFKPHPSTGRGKLLLNPEKEADFPLMMNELCK